jgi:hypothetical protein
MCISAHLNMYVAKLWSPWQPAEVSAAGQRCWVWLICVCVLLLQPAVLGFAGHTLASKLNCHRKRAVLPMHRSSTQQCKRRPCTLLHASNVASPSFLLEDPALRWYLAWKSQGVPRGPSQIPDVLLVKEVHQSSSVTLASM